MRPRARRHRRVEGFALRPPRRWRRESAACDGRAHRVAARRRWGRGRGGRFYDEVRALSSDERAAIAALPYDEPAYLAQVGAPSPFGEPGYTTLERQWDAVRRVEVNGLWGGYQGRARRR